MNSAGLFDDFAFDGADMFGLAEGTPADLANIPFGPGVYALFSENAFCRFLGESDILKIGSAGGGRGLRGRLYGYFRPGPTQITNQRIAEAVALYPIARLGMLSVGWKVVLDRLAAIEFEGLLLQQYRREHGELPPWNHSTR
jgi:hypothetical protein